MNYIDMFIIVLLIWAVFRGFTQGFIMQLTLLAALALGIFAALKLSGFTAEKLVDYISVSSESLYLISIGITFVLVFIGVNLVGKLVEKMVEAVQLSFINRLFGVIFSLGKTVILLGILLAFIDRIDQHTPLSSKIFQGTFPILQTIYNNCHNNISLHLRLRFQMTEALRNLYELKPDEIMEAK